MAIILAKNYNLIWRPDYSGLPEHLHALYRARLTNPLTLKTATPQALKNAKIKAIAGEA